MTSPGEGALQSVRRLLLALLGCGLAGTVVELILLGHDEDTKQLIPLFVVGPTLAILVWHGFSQGRISTPLFRLGMLALIAAGGAGVFFHGQASSEFQTEMDASLKGLALMKKVLHAKAPPALAPAHLALLGLFGLVSTYKQGSRTAGDGRTDRGV